jgi:hypothetical protein
VKGVDFIPHPLLVRLALNAGWGRSSWIEPATKARVRYAAKKGYGGLIGYITKDVRQRHLNGHAYSFSRRWVGGRVTVERDADGLVWMWIGSELEARSLLGAMGFVDAPGGVGPQGRAPPDWVGYGVM